MTFKQMRLKAGYRTADDFSKAAGVSADIVRQWESNFCAPRAKVLKRIAAALGVSVDELLDCECFR